MSNSGDPSPGCHINDPIPTSQVILFRCSSIYSIWEIGRRVDMSHLFSLSYEIIVILHQIHLIEVSSLNVSSKYNLIISKKNGNW